MTVDAKIALSVLAAFSVLGLLAAMGIVVVIGMARERAAKRSRETGSATLPQESGWTLFRRGLARRCPICGRGPIFQSHFKMNQVCSQCGAVFWKNEGEWLGPAVMDYTVISAGMLIAWAATSFFGLSEFAQVSIAATVGSLALMVLAPWSRSLWTVLLYMCGEMEAPDAKPQ